MRPWDTTPASAAAWAWSHGATTSRYVWASGLVRDGRLSAGVLLWLADWEACREAVAGDGTIIVVTRELRLRVLQHVEVDGTTVIVARASPLRRSSRNSVIEVRIHRED